MFQLDWRIERMAASPTCRRSRLQGLPRRFQLDSTEILPPTVASGGGTAQEQDRGDAAGDRRRDSRGEDEGWGRG